ncbi:MAG: GDP-L-fucose synthase [Flavobacteriales bacterium]|nr:GDP-L-fucose synthase [Flavobacteriales bacterium]
MNHNSKIYIAGHNGMVGSACLRLLRSRNFKNLIFKSSKELDLRDQIAVNSFFEEQKPDAVIIAAARVGGIHANNTFGYDFLIDNLQIQNNLISASEKNNVEKVIFLGSSCIYPKMASQPLKEDYLLTGSLEETNQWYAIAKIAGVKSIEALNKYKNKNFVSLMPTNLYGQNDNYDLNNSHVLPALIRKFHEAKVNNHSEVVLWGSGEPLREFLHVDDLAEAILFSLVNNLDSYLYNVGSGHEISIKDLAAMIQQIIGHKGKIIWNKSMPNGTPRKILDSNKLISLGWSHKIELKEGIKDVYLHLESSKFTF